MRHIAVSLMLFAAAGSAGAATSYADFKQARNASTTTISIASQYGGLWANNDVIVAQLFLGTGGAAETVTAPAGWTKLRQRVSSGSQAHLYYIAVAPGFPASTTPITWTWTNAQSAILTFMVIRGADTANPFDDQGMDNPASNPPATSIVSCSTKYAQGGGHHVMWLFHNTGIVGGNAYLASDGITLYPGNRRVGTSIGNVGGAMYEYAIPAGSAGTLPQYMTTPATLGSDMIGVALTLRPSGGSGSTTTSVCAGSGGGSPTYTVSVSNPAAYVQGQSITWTATVSSSGTATTGAAMTFTLPSGVSSLGWTCTNGTGGTCGAASGSGTTTTANFAAPGSVTYTFTGTVAPTTSAASLALTVQVSGGTPSGTTKSATGTSTQKLSNFLVSPSVASVCVPAGTVGYTITARDSGNATITNFAGTVNLSMGGYTSASWSGTNVTNGGSGAGTVTFVSGSGTATATLTPTAAGSGTASATLGAATGSSSAVTFTSTGTMAIAITDSQGSVPIAARDHTMTLSYGSCAYTGSRPVKVYAVQSGSHPAGATAPSLTDGAGSVLLASIPWADPGATNATVAFSSGTASLRLRTTDVGQYTLYIVDAVSANTGLLTVRPWVVAPVFSGSNPGTTSATGTVFTTAGTSFGVTLKAVAYDASKDGNADLAPDAGVNFGANAALTRVTGLSATLSAPSVGSTEPVLGTLSGAGAIALTNGVSSGLSLAYNEVGSFNMNTLISNYLGSGASVSYTLPVGRFIPAGFVLQASSVANRQSASCGSSAFNYLGESMRISATMEARSGTGAGNPNGTRTQNYTGSWARFNDGTWASIVVSDPTLFPTRNGNGSGTVLSLGASGASVITAGTWATGRATMQVDVTPQRQNSASEGPYSTVYVGLKRGTPIADADGVALAFNLDADAVAGNESVLIAGPVVYYAGRVSVQSRSGLATAQLSSTIALEYYNGAAWVVNASDNCTGLPASSFKVSTGVPFTNGGATTCYSSVSFNSASATGSTTAPVTSGTSTLYMQPPGIANAGAGTLTLNLGTASGVYCSWPALAPAAATGQGMTYLRANGPGGADPTASINFTVPSAAGVNRFQYRRETW